MHPKHEERVIVSKMRLSRDHMYEDALEAHNFLTNFGIPEAERDGLTYFVIPLVDRIKLALQKSL